MALEALISVTVTTIRGGGSSSADLTAEEVRTFFEKAATRMREGKLRTEGREAFELVDDTMDLFNEEDEAAAEEAGEQEPDAEEVEQGE